MVEVDLDRSRRGALIDHDINTIVLHGRVEVLLHDRRETMDLIDEKDIVGFERSEQTCQVTGFIEDRSGSDLEAYAEFVGDDVTEGRFSESRRAEEKHMVETLPALFGGLDEDLEVRGHLTLSGKVGKAQRAKGVVLFLLGHLLSNIKFHNMIDDWTIDDLTID